jgi:hypothetical protein
MILTSEDIYINKCITQYTPSHKYPTNKRGGFTENLCRSVSPRNTWGPQRVNAYWPTTCRSVKNLMISSEIRSIDFDTALIELREAPAMEYHDCSHPSWQKTVPTSAREKANKKSTRGFPFKPRLPELTKFESERFPDRCAVRILGRVQCWRQKLKPWICVWGRWVELDDD